MGLNPSELRRTGLCIGRESELAELGKALEQAFEGRGLLTLLSGEPGIGKTCLARALADDAEAAGAVVLWGTCWEGDGAPAFWPWIQIVREHARRATWPTLLEELGSNAADIIRLLPEADNRLPGLPAADRDLVSEHGRFRLFDAVATLCRLAADRTPVVLVLDDLHWADVPSLLLLRYLARELIRSRVLVLGMFREAELTRGDTRSQILADLVKESGLHLTLPGLDPERVAALMESTAGQRPHEAVAASVHHRTKGNPFYVREFTRLLAAHHAVAAPDPARLFVAGIPEGVRDVVERRLARLSADTVAVLGVAAVIGPDFTVELLSRVTRVDTLTLLGHLDEAAEARTVTASTTTPGLYEFEHELLRDALYDLQGAGRRVDAHRRVAEALEGSPDAGLRVAEIAHHFFRAAAGGDAERAVRYAIRAGDHAVSVFAYEDAVVHYERALRAMGGADEHQRGELLLAVGDARRRMGDADQASATFHQAADLARRLGDAPMLARAALGASSGIGGWGVSARADEQLISLLEEALAVLGDADPALRARLLSRLAVELYWTDQVDRRHALSEEAVALARRLGDPTVELLALYSRHWAALSPDTLDERLTAADELLQLARQVGNREAAYLGHQFRATALIERGETAAVAAEVAACERIADELRMPLYRWQTAVLQVMGSMLDGALEEAEHAIQGALGAIQDADSEIASQVFGGQMLVIRWLQGRIEEFEPAIRAYIEQIGPFPAWRAALAFAHVEMGQLEAAEAIFSDLAADDFTDIPRDGLRLITIWALARVCAGLRDEVRAALLYEVVKPYAHLDVVAGPAAISLGSTSMSLALLAATLRRWDDAEQHFMDAEARNAATRNRPLLAWTLLGHADMLFDRARSGDAAAAGELIERALAVIEGTSVDGLRRRAHELAASTGPREQPLPSRFRREGAVWLIEYAGRGVRLKDSKGLRDIAQLVAVPGREIHVIELVPASSDRTVRPGEAAQAGLSAGMSPGSDPILDEPARKAYRARILELEEELTDAEDGGDDERAANARAERDLLAAQLAAAYGLGGRARRSGDPVERARKAVAWRIRDAIRRIEHVHPALGRHLDRSVRTGTFCSYVPDPPTAWTST